MKRDSGSIGHAPETASCLFALTDRGLTDGAKIIYCALIELVNSHPPSSKSWLRKESVATTVDELSELLGIDSRTVSASLAQLQSKGLVKIDNGCADTIYCTPAKKRSFRHNWGSFSNNDATPLDSENNNPLPSGNLVAHPSSCVGPS